MCWFSGMLLSFCNNFMLPKRRFRKPKNISDRRFEHFSRVWVLDLGYGYLKKAVGNVFRFSKNPRLGSINFARWLQEIVAIVMRCVGFLGCYYLFVTILCSPNEDFGRPSKRQCGEQKVALSALGEILLRKVVKKVDNAKITSNATI